MIVRPAGDGFSLNKRRDENRWHPESSKSVNVSCVTLYLRHRRDRRRNMIEETSPLVERENQQRFLPQRTRRHCFVDTRHEALCVSDVTGWMIAVAQVISEIWIDE